jgi:adenine-specific DNA-methyltransferase
MLQATFETAFKTVKKLVEDFDDNKDYYLSSSYKEDSARHDFIDKFFIALGWDVNHETDKNPYEQEAHIESNVNAQGKRKRADYAFYLAPNFRDVVFYAEAKKPSVQIENADDYFQTIRYGYSSKTPLAVLTDFEQFHVLDCRYAPSIATALDRFVKKYSYNDYLNKEKFAEIYYLFSREAVAGGSIEKRTLELPKARGGAVQLGLFKGAYKPIDEALLDELDGYRNTLAHAFKNGNPELDHWALTEIVQRTIDRLVFIRFLEDKLIEPEDIISNFGTKSESAWMDFVSTCRKLDKVYNGTIYKKHDILDAPNFKLDENAFADICEKLSGKNTPYDFDKIPIHILGSIYERFLGKIITTTAKRARVEEKPEVKKAGGVFYTPEYIVRHIVENTIGKLIKNKTPEEVAGMRFADIACGSGSFLLGAYDYLLRYHANYYNKNPKQATARDCVERDGALCLTLHKKREILLNNIYGVDIDQQAVEVSQLSLYLKLLENETLGTTAASLRAESGETVLPSLIKNIRCGNSLIGPDFYEGVQEEMPLYENKPIIREINAFDWKVGFPEIMRKGGFDAVIGNPPYGATLSKDMVTYFQKSFEVAQGELDSYALFIERSLDLLGSNALLGIIVPDTWLTLVNASQLRHFILENFTIIEIDSLNEFIFLTATIDPLLLFIKKELPNKNHNTYLNSLDKKCHPSGCLEFNKTSQAVQKNWITNSNYQINVLITKENISTISKCKFNSVLLFDLIEYRAGCKPYEVGKGFPPQTKETLSLKPFTSFKKVASDWKPLIRGDDVQKYFLRKKKPEYIKYGKWLAAPREWRVFSGERLLIQAIRNPSIDNRIISTYTNEDVVSRINVYSLILKPRVSLHYYFLLGILNSSLMNWLLKKIYGLHTYVITGVLQLPIKIIDKSTVKLENNIIALVSMMLNLHNKIPLGKADQEKAIIQHQIESVDRRIDELVYELYGLTPEEIKIVEESIKN